MTISAESGFAGPTHLILAGLFAAGVAFAAPWFIQLAPDYPLLLLAWFTMVAAGASLVPDADNTASSFRSYLGPLGDGLSRLSIASSTAIQRALRTTYDTDQPDPHRGFWHTLEGAGALTALTWLVCQAPYGATIMLAGYGYLAIRGAITMINRRWATIMLLVVTAVCAWYTQTLLTTIAPAWVPVAAGVGIISHVVGDKFTARGTVTSIVFNRLFRHKIWYNTSFAPIESGGPTEQRILRPVLTAIWIITLLIGVGMKGWIV